MGLALIPFNICTAHQSVQSAFACTLNLPCAVLSHTLRLLCLCVFQKNLGVLGVTLK